MLRERGYVMTRILMRLDALAAAERRDLANALLRAGWSALDETRVLLLDVDRAILHASHVRPE